MNLCPISPIIRLLIGAVFLSCSLCGSASAAIFSVPSQYPTIQTAVNAAQSGDTVLIADGTYTGPGNVDIDFGGKNLTVTSQNGADETIIDCQGSAASPHRGFYLHSGETNAVISGLTIQNGYQQFGGGAASLSVSGTIQNCILKNNTATNSGGGVYNFISLGNTIKVIGCTFTGNTATSGGGVGNNALGNDDKALMTGCTFTGNTAAAYGGGVYNGCPGTITMTGCSITGNTAGFYGGGLYNNFFSNGTITLTGCTVTGNRAAYCGGGAYNAASFGLGDILTFTNCTVTGNTAGYYGGGLYNYTVTGSALMLTNSTVTGNTAPYGGGGLYNYSLVGSAITLSNTIAYGDTGGEVYTDPSSVGANTVTYCDVKGGYSGAGNLNADPVFVNAGAGDLHLSPGSKCFAAGTSAGAPATDMDGVTRPTPPSIGAYDNALTGTTTTHPHPPTAPPVVTTPTAVFVGLDATAGGTWKGVYGKDGDSIAQDSVSYPSYATVTATGQAGYTWAASTTDGRAMLKAASTTDHLASCWYANSSFTLDVNLTGGQAHQVGVYCLDWDNAGRTERIDVLDAASGTVLDSQTVSAFSGGKYLFWKLQGHVLIKVTALGSNAVVSGLLFDAPDAGLAAPAPSISGTASLQGWMGTPQPLTCTLTPTGATAARGILSQIVTPAADGSFSLTNVPVGTYTLGLQCSHWLKKNMTVNTTGGTVSGLSVTLLSGDVNGDGVVNGVDISMISAAFRTHAGDANWNANCDLNGDGVVNGLDLSIASSNFRKQGDP